MSIPNIMRCVYSRVSNKYARKLSFNIRAVWSKTRNARKLVYSRRRVTILSRSQDDFLVNFRTSIGSFLGTNWNSVLKIIMGSNWKRNIPNMRF